MKKNHIFLIISIFLFAVTCCAEDHRVRCGVVTAQTGVMKSSGVGIKNAMVLASEDAGFNQNIEFLFEDDQFLPKNTVSVVKKLIALDKVDCLVVFGSTTSLAVADIAEQMKVPLIAIAISPEVVSGRSYVLRAHLSSERQVETILPEIRNHIYKSVALVTTNQDATLSLREHFLPRTDLSVVLDEVINPDEVELKSLAVKIQSLHADSVFLNLLPPQGSGLARELKNIGFKGELFSGAPLANPSELKIAKGALDGAWFVSLDSVEAKDFFIQYRKRFSEEAPIQSLYGYEAAWLISSLPAGGNIFENIIQAKSFKGFFGDYHIKDHMIDFPSRVWEVKNSQFVVKY